MRRAIAVAAVLVAGSLTAGCAGAGHQLPAISEADSNRAAARIAAAPRLKLTTRTTYQNERIARRVMSRLQANAEPICDAAGRKTCWFTLEYSPKGKLNAGALKNQIILFDGLAQYLETEDEFAAVLAHEMGHHIAYHYEKGIQNRTVGALIAGIIFAGIAGATNAYGYNSYQAQSDTQTAMKLGAAIGDISFSKEHEREADYIASYLLARAGYNPEVAGQIWIKLTKATGHLETKLLDTHPAGPERLAAWEHAVEEVRYSSDLIPNLENASAEPRLQQARLFNASSDLTPADEPTLAAVSNSKNYQTSAMSTIGSALGATGKSLAPYSSVLPGNGTWMGRGTHDTCGASWAINAQKTGSKLRGNMWWKGVKYDLYGDIDITGRAKDVRAGKNKESRNIPGPRFFALDLTFAGDKATGSYHIDSRSASCQTNVSLSRN